MENIKVDIKHERMRGKQRKWTVGEVTSILGYIIDKMAENKLFEKPTAMLYYSAMAQEIGLNIEPILIKNKMRNLKNTYTKALDWLNGTDPDEHDDETIKEHIKTICPFWDQLQEIFSDKLNLTPSIVLSAEVDLSINNEEHKYERNINTSNGVAALTELHRIKSVGLEERLKIQREKLEIKRMKLELEREKICLERDKLLSNEKLKILEMEKDERIARYEIEMKYQKH